MTREEAIKKYPYIVLKIEKILIREGVNLHLYRLTLSQRGDGTLDLYFEYQHKALGLRGSDPENPDHNFIVNSANGNIVSRIYGR